MTSMAATVEEYLADLPDDRRTAIEAVREVILANLDKGIQEGMQYGMIAYSIPHSVYPPGYHCDPKQPLPHTALASQKNYMALYLGIYSDPDLLEWFTTEWKKAGKKLDMGKSCLRFKKLEDLDLDLIGESLRRLPVDQFVANYESVIKPPSKK